MGSGNLHPNPPANYSPGATWRTSGAYVSTTVVLSPAHFPSFVLPTTNTAYSIYWVPAAPANTVLPKITGASKVGKKLTASHGTWSYSPTSYAYRWLRCSSAGTNPAGSSGGDGLAVGFGGQPGDYTLPAIGEKRIFI